eukprot:6201215-Pleurochrysis_carterae.AAC.1
MTLSVGRVKDNTEGLRHMLGDGKTIGIGAEILDISSAGVVSFVGVVDNSEWVIVNHCKPSTCLDLAAA